MHRHLRRIHLHRQFSISFFIFALGLCAGCGFVYPPPSIPDSIQKEMFHVSEPVALLSFAPGRTGGRIIGELHGWPFPHVEGTEGIPTNNFTYVGQFNVTIKSDDDGMPAGAEGARKVYFHEDPMQLNFADPRGYAAGQQAALDSISLTFTFQQNHRLVAVRMISEQKSASPFSYKGKKVSPPTERSTADTLQGEYSADLGCYVLRSMNE
jgi:hypothetical protein